MPDAMTQRLLSVSTMPDAMTQRLASIPNLFADPIRMSGEPAMISASASAAAAKELWWKCEVSSERSRIPNVIHQPWLHGTTPKWEHILGMLSARFIVRPERYVLYYDKTPPPSPQWACVCAIATECVRRRPATAVRHGPRIRMAHWPELMRYDVLLDNGGIFLDHDSYALTPLDDVRQCCAPGERGKACEKPAAVLGGLERDWSGQGLHKLNPGTLMAEPNAEFLQLWRASWSATHTAAAQRPHIMHCRTDTPIQAIYSAHRIDAYVARAHPHRDGAARAPPWLIGRLCSRSLVATRVVAHAHRFNYSARDWDYNCCQVSYRLHTALGRELHSHLRADLGPLPRYATEEQYDAHLRVARVVHVTALSQPWRQRDSRQFGIMEKVSRLVLRRANASAAYQMTPVQRQCLEATAFHMRKFDRSRTDPPGRLKQGRHAGQVLRQGQRAHPYAHVAKRVRGGTRGSHDRPD